MFLLSRQLDEREERRGARRRDETWISLEESGWGRGRSRREGGGWKVEEDEAISTVDAWSVGDREARRAKWRSEAVSRASSVEQVVGGAAAHRLAGAKELAWAGAAALSMLSHSAAGRPSAPSLAGQGVCARATYR